MAGAAAIIGACALFLGTWQKRQRLGEPGIRVVNQPVEGIEASPSGTNIFVAGTSSIYLPENVPGYESRALPITKLVVDWLPKDTTYGQRIYKATNGFEIQMMGVLMGTDRTSIHLPDYCLRGGGWLPEPKEKTTISVDRPVPYELPVMRIKVKNTYRDANGQDHKLSGVFVYWLVADGQLTASHRQLMWWMGRDLLRTGVLQRWAYITHFSICRPGDEEATYARMSEFIRASVPQYQLTPVAAEKVASASRGSN